MTIENRPFGHTTLGEAVDCYTLINGGMTAEILTYGGILRSLVVPAEDGPRDVVLGFDDIEGYLSQNCFIGAIIGRVANRIGGARFTLGDKTYTLAENDGRNCLHSGLRGFDKRCWDATVQGGVLALSLVSPDGEEGFPGTLNAEVRYSLGDNSLTIEYMAVCDADTPVSLTNHSYFNLNGHNGGLINDHCIRIFSETITETDEEMIPTGNIKSVDGTPFNLRRPVVIGSFGYDNNFILSERPKSALRRAAVLTSGGLRMTCLSTQPGLQFYSGNSLLSGASGKGGVVYGRRTGLCLETQGWPDAVNQDSFPSCILRKGETYRHKTVYRFDYYYPKRT